MKNLINIAFKHALVFVLFSLLYLAIFRTSIFTGISVFFYRGVVLLLLLTLIELILMFFLKAKKLIFVFSYHDIVLSSTLFLCLNLVFFTHVPVTADRSLTVFMLGTMVDNKVSTEEDLKKEFINVYIDKNENIKKRLDEQIISGNVIKSGDNYLMTDKGKRLMKFYDLIAKAFLIPDSNVHPTSK